MTRPSLTPSQITTAGMVRTPALDGALPLKVFLVLSSTSIGRPRRGKGSIDRWDAAEWEIIEPLLEAGELPYLTHIIESGVMGRLATLDPSLIPLTWTSVATGRIPPEHGVLGLDEPAEDGIDVRSSSSESRSSRKQTANRARSAR